MNRLTFVYRVTLGKEMRHVEAGSKAEALTKVILNTGYPTNKPLPPNSHVQLCPSQNIRPMR